MTNRDLRKLLEEAKDCWLTTKIPHLFWNKDGTASILEFGSSVQDHIGCEKETLWLKEAEFEFKIVFFCANLAFDLFDVAPSLSIHFAKKVQKLEKSLRSCTDIWGKFCSYIFFNASSGYLRFPKSYEGITNDGHMLDDCDFDFAQRAFPIDILPGLQPHALNAIAFCISENSPSKANWFYIPGGRAVVCVSGLYLYSASCVIYKLSEIIDYFSKHSAKPVSYEQPSKEVFQKLLDCKRSGLSANSLERYLYRVKFNENHHDNEPIDEYSIDVEKY